MVLVKNAEVTRVTCGDRGAAVSALGEVRASANRGIGRINRDDKRTGAYRRRTGAGARAKGRGGSELRRERRDVGHDGARRVRSAGGRRAWGVAAVV